MKSKRFFMAVLFCLGMSTNFHAAPTSDHKVCSELKQLSYDREMIEYKDHDLAVMMSENMYSRCMNDFE